jgi:hypothetical protein
MNDLAERLTMRLKLLGFKPVTSGWPIRLDDGTVFELVEAEPNETWFLSRLRVSTVLKGAVACNLEFSVTPGEMPTLVWWLPGWLLGLRYGNPPKGPADFELREFSWLPTPETFRSCIWSARGATAERRINGGPDRRFALLSERGN